MFIKTQRTVHILKIKITLNMKIINVIQGNEIIFKKLLKITSSFLPFYIIKTQSKYPNAAAKNLCPEPFRDTAKLWME